MKDSVSILILAAGSSSRLGTSKQLLRVEGQTLLSKTIKTALNSSTGNISVVLGSDHEIHQQSIADLNVDTIINPAWQSGMGSSIKAGLHHLMSVKKGLAGVIILVCDQPLLSSDHINSILKTRTHTGKNIVASAYSDSQGVPAFFSEKYFAELLDLGDDEGAKKVAVVSFPEGASDIDTMDDYRAFLNDSAR
jgi:molybdenum cofactor cytidylyltransferase